MRFGRNVGVAALAGATVVVGLAGVAAASGGRAVLLGHINRVSGSTEIKASSGTALVLKSRPSSPSLSVSNKQQIPHLNASYLNGLTAQQIEAAAKAGLPAGGGAVTEEVASMSGGLGIAMCPAGTAPIGGGVVPDPTGTSTDDIPFVVASTPHVTSGTLDGWEAVVSDFDGTYNGGGEVFVSCEAAVTQPASASRSKMGSTAQRARSAAAQR